MTAQAPDWLIVEDERLPLFSNPLGQYLGLAHLRVDFEARTSANWRGYVATWELRDDRFYLVDLSGRVKDGGTVSVASFFPEFPERVFAHWCSGTLRTPLGKLTHRVRAGYGAHYEKYRLFDVRLGVVVEQRDVSHNQYRELYFG